MAVVLNIIHGNGRSREAAARSRGRDSACIPEPGEAREPAEVAHPGFSQKGSLPLSLVLLSHVKLVTFEKLNRKESI